MSIVVNHFLQTDFSIKNPLSIDIKFISVSVCAQRMDTFVRALLVLASKLHIIKWWCEILSHGANFTAALVSNGDHFSENVEESQSHKMHLAYIQIHPLDITLIKCCFLVANIMKFPSEWFHWVAPAAVENDKMYKRCFKKNYSLYPLRMALPSTFWGKIAIKKLFAQKAAEFDGHLKHGSGSKPRCGAVNLTLGCGCRYLFALCCKQ